MPDEENMPSKQTTKLFFMAVPNQVMDALSLAQGMGGRAIFCFCVLREQAQRRSMLNVLLFSAHRHRRYTTAVVAGGEGA